MILIIADDLTGANDTGVQFQKKGYSTFVDVLSKDECQNDLEAYDVISINTDSRSLSKKEAYDKVYHISKKYINSKISVLYKKIDSMFRGHPGSELDAVMDASGLNVAFVAPSYPENDRRIENGILYTSSYEQINITEKLKSKKKTCNINLDIIRGDRKILRDSIYKNIDDGAEVFLFDGVTRDDLRIVYEMSLEVDVPKLYCGSAGFADVFDASTDNSLHEHTVSKQGKAIIVVGSIAKETAYQVKRISSIYDAPVSLLKIEDIIWDKVESIQNSIDSIKKLAHKDDKPIIIAVDSLFNYEKYHSEDSIEESKMAIKIVETLGSVVKETLEETVVDTIISVGGDTSLQVCKALGVRGIYLMDEIVSGIPIGRIIGGPWENLTIVTKSGSFGKQDALYKVLQYLT